MNIKLLPESHDEVRDQIGVFFDDYRNQREDLDEVSEVTDSMYKGGTARGHFDKEERKWIPLITDSKSNVGSVLLHRQVNTRAGMLGAIISSGRELWKYKDKYVEGVPLAQHTGSFEAGILNAFAKWCLKEDGWQKKAPELCTSVYKDGNIFVQVGMKEEERDIWEAEDKQVGETENPSTGEMEPVYEKVLKPRKGVACGYPSFTFPYPRNIFMDKYISDVQSQSCVVMHSFTNKAKLMADPNLDQEVVMELESGDLWDGTYGGDAKEADAENEGRDYDPTKVSGSMLRWDVWLDCPMLNGEWFDPEEAEGDKDYEIKRLYIVGVGNEPGSLKIVKITDQFHPQGEIPLQIIRAIPSDGDMLYHITHGEVIRAMYCAECGIRNALIDNFGIRSRPPIEINVNSMGLIKDLTWKPDAKWFTDGPNAIQKWEPPDITMQAQGLIDQIREETKLALATDSARLGEYAGARTSKYEVQRVTGATDTTIALQNAYVIGQLLPWMARQMLEYTRKYVDAEVIRRVVNAHLPQPVQGDKIGEYDIEVDIVGEYMDDQEKAAQAMEAMQIISNPANAQLLPPQTRLALIKQFLEARKFDVARLDFEGWQKDSEANAMSRIEQILNTGILIPPQEGENIAVHLRVARAQHLRWQGLANSPDPRAANAPLLAEYIQALEMMQQQQEQQLAMMQQGMGEQMGGEQMGGGMEQGGMM